jgi:hypothetical protein
VILAFFFFDLHAQMLFKDAHLVVLSAEYVILIVNNEVDVRLLGQLRIRKQLDLVINCVLGRKDCLFAILWGPLSPG